MENRSLGKTGLRVSELCLGTMTFGENNWGLPTTTEEHSVAMMNRFLAAGGNFLDTANVYGLGNSESIVGRWLTTQSRDGLIVATKCRFPMGKGPNDEGSSRKHILSSIEASLKRLQTDYVDLMQVHCWDYNTPLEETIRTLDDLIRVGKVRYVGVSNFTGYQLQQWIDLAKFKGFAPLACLQPQYHLLCRAPEWELLPACLQGGVGVIPWSPLAGGLLSGKYDKNSPPLAHSRADWADKAGWSETSFQRHNVDQTWAIVDAMREVGKEAGGKSCAQVALRWLLDTPGVTAPIIGAKTMAQLEDNLGAVGWKLTAAQKAKLDDISAIPTPYPYRIVEKMGKRTIP